MKRRRGLSGTPGAQRGNYAMAYVGKDSGGATAYCAPTKAHAQAHAQYSAATIGLCTAIAKGATCNDAKKAAKRAAVEKCRPCRRYGVEYGTGDRAKWAVVEIDPRNSSNRRVVAIKAAGAETMNEIDRLARAGCPGGNRETAEETALGVTWAEMTPEQQRLHRREIEQRAKPRPMTEAELRAERRAARAEYVEATGRQR